MGLFVWYPDCNKLFSFVEKYLVPASYETLYLPNMKQVMFLSHLMSSVF